MRSATVLEAFDALITELDEEVREAREAAATAIREGRDGEADKLRRFIRAITRLRAKAHTLRQEWLRQIEEKARRGRKRGAALPRAARGARVREEEYYVPILRALVRLGGEGKVAQVLELVYEQIKDRLTQVDLSPLASDPRMLRWRNAAMWARMGLVRRGLMLSSTTRGVWAISSRGREYLATAEGQK